MTPTQAQIEAALNSYADKITEIFDRGNGLAPEDRKAAMTVALTAAAEAGRACTCHPADNPPDPCPKQYAYTECVRAATIERCAQVAERAINTETGIGLAGITLVAKIAAKIRALKDKP